MRKLSIVLSTVGILTALGTLAISNRSARAESPRTLRVVRVTEKPVQIGQSGEVHGFQCAWSGSLGSIECYALVLGDR